MNAMDAGDELLDSALGCPGFPWQRRLLRKFLAGDLPDALDLPTGLGKTSVMTIWLVARVLGAELPRRLIYVVDRRAVVDQATREAERLREWLDAHPDVCAALGLEGKLPISTLRGQFADNRIWLEDPTVPAIVVGTVDMIGSRLLFGGYGCSRKMRPYHAGLLGSDALFVIDESHLVPPFERMVRDAVATGPLRREVRGLPPSRLVSLSATGSGWSAPFRLDHEDHAHEVVAQRVAARKRVHLHPDPVRSAELAGALAARAWSIVADAPEGSRVLVFTAKRDDAESVRDGLLKRSRVEKRTIDVELMVGARRIHERSGAEARLKTFGFLAGSARPERTAVLVATSAGEVGVDLDADHLVCDLVAWERMVQRLGRVNRRGEGDAEVHVIPAEPPDAKKAPKELARWSACRELIGLLPLSGDAVDGSPRALGALTRAPETAPLALAATTPEPLRPALSLPLLEAWAMTSLEDHTGRPPLAPWLRGWVAEPPNTAVAWRRLLPTKDTGEKLTDAFFEAAPPHLTESLEAPTHRVLAWLLDRAKAVRTPDTAGSCAVEDAERVVFVLDRTGSVERAYELTALDPGSTRDKERLHRELSGRQIVIDARLGGLSDSGLLNAKESSVPWTLDEDVPPAGDETVPYRVRRVLVDAEVEPFGGVWREHLRVPIRIDGNGVPTESLAVGICRSNANTEDGRSAASRAQSLEEHQSWAEAEAVRIAERLNLPAEFGRLLALAARLHDEGKRADRWQRAFSAPAGGPFAKTRGPLRVRLLEGYRHELGSLPYAEADATVRALSDADRDIVLHLIAAHHGFARPRIPTTGCDDAPPSRVVERARAVALRYVALQERFGPWGLAWLEMLLRAADQRASRRNDEVKRG